jgi:alanyl-tRNA synthetase
VIGESTRVTYPGGVTAGRPRVVHCEERDGRLLVVTEETPFHPLDHLWPDQPADRGHLGDLPVLDVLTGAVRRGEDTLHLGRDIPARRGEEGWSYVVVHVVDVPQADLTGASVELQVDESYRRLLCATHTACHLMSIALNQVTADLWTKEPPRDSLGNPNLDKKAIAHSAITDRESRDHYRFGKSLRKEGFEAGAFLDRLPEVAVAIDATVAAWLTTGGEISIEPGTCPLDARRLWRAVLAPGTVAEISCGGTHLASLQDLAAVSVSIDRHPDQPEITVKTTASLR